MKYFSRYSWNDDERRRKYCKKCGNARMRRLREVNPDWHWKRRYGLTMEDYLRLAELQHGLCAICFAPPTPYKRSPNRSFLHVDHSHKSGLVRGLLCQKCNRGIGQFLDDPSLLRAAAVYLEKEGKVMEI